MTDEEKTKKMAEEMLVELGGLDKLDPSKMMLIVRLFSNFAEALIRARAQARAEAIRAFANDILHGDSEHRSWLLEAAETFIAGKLMPPARGGANAAARAEALEEAAQIAEAQPYYFDTHTGMRQQWVNDEIMRKIRDLVQAAPTDTKKPGQREADPG